jgi:hypothetical protein
VTRSRQAGARATIVTLPVTPDDAEMAVIVRGKACDVLAPVLAEVGRAGIPP